MLDQVLHQLKRVEAAIASLRDPPVPKHGKTGIPPWHMWGNSQTLSVLDSASVVTPATEGQLIRIGYGRPDTWHWVFFARILEAPSMPGGSSTVLSLSFELTIGVGRAVIVIPQFELFTWSWGDAVQPVNPPLNRVKWSSQALGRCRVDTTNASFFDPWSTAPVPDVTNPNGVTNTRSVSNVVDKIVAQDIQLRALLLMTTTLPTEQIAKVEVGALFSPKTHLRPEWNLHRFPGGEEG